MKKIVLFMLAICSGTISNAQVGPNVVAGAGSVVYNKGTLDAELILEMVATKKGEIKTELGKRLVLSRIENGSFAFYNYAEKNLDILFNQAEKEIMMKEIMRNSAELLLVYGIAEAYLADLKYKERTGTQNKFIEVVKKHIEKDAEFDQILEIKDEMKYSADNYNPWVENPQKPIALPLLTSDNNSYRESRLRFVEKYINYNMSHVFVDMVYDVCRKNKYVLKTGLFQNNNYSEERYQALNKFYVMDKKEAGEDEIYNSIKALRPEINEIINEMFRYYSIMEELSNLAEINKKSIDSLRLINLEPSLMDYLGALNIDASVSSDPKVQELLKAFKSMTSTAKCLNNSLQQVKIALKTIKGKHLPASDKLSLAQDELFKKLSLFNLLNEKQLENHLSDYKYTLEKEIIPQLTSLNNSSENDFTNLLNSCISLSGCIQNSLLNEFMVDTLKFNAVIGKIQSYLPLVMCIDNLNRVESYDYIFKYITNLAETFNNQQAKTVVSWITSSADKYTTINTDENKLTIDVEAIATDFYSRFAKNQQGRFNMLLSVGVNNNVSINGIYEYTISSDTATQKLFSHQFVSEKIGVRFNLMDFNRRRFFGNYDLEDDSFAKHKRRAAKINKSPLIDNWHVQAYGSGLLYQIAALNSETTFDKPMYGFGTGITFFNGLDLSVNYMAPFEDNFRNGFFNLAFDVNIMEYLGELKKKKKVSKE